MRTDPRGLWNSGENRGHPWQARFILLGISAGFCLGLTGCLSPHDFVLLAKTKLLFLPIESKYHLKLRSDSAAFFPDWRTSPEYRAECEEIEPDQLRRMPAILNQALARYPKGFVAQHLKTIALAKRMSFYGVDYGATCGPGVIFMAVRPEMDEDYLFLAFHHELAHLLLHQKPFQNLKRWEALNPGGFVYPNNAIQAAGIKRGMTQPEMLAQGFLSDFCRSSFSEDFCYFSAFFFLDPGRYHYLLEQYPKLKAKFELWLDYYHDLDPRFTAEYFFTPSGPWN